jgi:hypothetical protein
MGEFLKSYYSYFILLFFSIPLFFIGINDIHNWGDDYAQYILEAKNIAAGKPYYRTGYIYNDLNPEYAPPHYPPGFPLLLAPLVKFTGIAIKPMLYLITLLMVAMLFTFFAYFKKHIGTVTALCLAIIGVYCGAMMELKGSVLSDIPAALFVAIYLLLRNKTEFSWKEIVGLALIAAMATLTRSQSVLLIFAEIIFFLITIVKGLIQKSFSVKSLYQHISIRISVVFLVIYLLISVLSSTPGRSYDFYMNLFHIPVDGLWARIGGNFNYLIELFKYLLRYNTNDLFLQALVSIVEYASLIFVLIGFVISMTKKINIDGLFFILTCGMIVVLSVYQGPRYLLPVLPIYLFYCYEGFRPLVPFIIKAKGKVLAVVFTLVYLLLGFHHFKVVSLPPNETPYTMQDAMAFDYIRNKINDSDIIVFSKPRALTLYTGKRTINMAWQVSPEKNKEKFESLKVKYMLARKGLDDDQIIHYLNETRSAIDTTTINELYTLYTVR